MEPHWLWMTSLLIPAFLLSPVMLLHLPAAPGPPLQPLALPSISQLMHRGINNPWNNTGCVCDVHTSVCV